MEKGSCSIPECKNGGKIVRTWCKAHYTQWYRYGDPLAGKNPSFGQTLAERLWAKVDKSPHPKGCWLWTGNLNGYGYGAYGHGGHGNNHLTHRVSWELVNGPIPKGLLIDHKCHVRNCVNPAHLRLVTHKQNRENLSGPTSRNTSGHLGVTWHKGKSRWMSSVSRKFQGYFPLYELHVAGYVARKGRNAAYTHNDRDRGEEPAYVITE